MISEAYRQEQAELHKNPNYGVASVSYAPFVSEIIKKTQATDILDYGAGKGRLAKSLTVDREVAVHHYDPAIEAWASPPEIHEFVACIDVLEHIEPEYLDSVLDDLKRVKGKTGVFSIHTGPAVKTLSDGRNAHLTQKPMEWWLPKIMERFSLVKMIKSNSGFIVVVEAISEH